MQGRCKGSLAARELSHVQPWDGQDSLRDTEQGRPSPLLNSAGRVHQSQAVPALPRLCPLCSRRRMLHARQPQSARGARWFGKPLSDPGLLDGDLLLLYCHLPRAEQARVAAAAGGTREAVLGLLADMLSTSLVF